MSYGNNSGEISLLLLRDCRIKKRYYFHSWNNILNIPHFFISEIITFEIASSFVYRVSHIESLKVSLSHHRTLLLYEIEGESLWEDCRVSVNNRNIDYFPFISLKSKDSSEKVVFSPSCHYSYLCRILV